MIPLLSHAERVLRPRNSSPLANSPSPFSYSSLFEVLARCRMTREEEGSETGRWQQQL